MAPLPAGYAPTLEKFLKSSKGQSLEASVEELISLLKRQHVKGAERCASATAHILLQVVAKSKWNDVDQLLGNVQKVGSRLTQAAPRQLVIGNIVRRVLSLIRDEAAEDRNGDGFGGEAISDVSALPTPVDVPSMPRRPGPTPMRPPALTTASSFLVSKSLFNLLSAAEPALSTAASSPTSGMSTPIFSGQASNMQALRSEVIDGIEEIMDEIGQVDDQIAGFAEVQIHPGDYVLVNQTSSTVEKFLVRAAARRSFTVFIANAMAPVGADDSLHLSFRKKLLAAGVKVISISSSGVAAYMPKVNKVILGAQAVLANGAVISDAGSATVARAACSLSKPVIVLSGVYKLCPEVAHDPEAAYELGDSSSHVSFADGALVGGVEVENIVTEYVPPELIGIYITNLGPHARDHLDDIMADHYKLEDVGLPPE